MAFTTIQGFTPTQTSENANGVPNFGTSPYESPTGENWQDAFLDTLQAGAYQNLAGVLSGGVCTVALLSVTIPANTVYVAGGMVWTNLTTETKAVTDDATTYVWGRADGQLDITATTTPPSGFEGGKSCLLTKAVAVAGVATLDNTVQHKARTLDHTNRTVNENAALLGFQGKRSVVAYASDANKTLLPAEYDGLIIDISAGVVTATRNLVFPLLDGTPWIVRNRTAQSIQCIGATGTGVTIATVKAAPIYADGVNINRWGPDVTP